MNRSLAERIELARTVEVPWDAARAARVSARIDAVRERPRLRSRWLEATAVAFASAALLLGLMRISGAPVAPETDKTPTLAAAPDSPRAPATERVLLADGALGDGGYEASLD